MGKERSGHGHVDESDFLNSQPLKGVQLYVNVCVWLSVFHVGSLSPHNHSNIHSDLFPLQTVIKPQNSTKQDIKPVLEASFISLTFSLSPPPPPPRPPSWRSWRWETSRISNFMQSSEVSVAFSVCRMLSVIKQHMEANALLRAFWILPQLKLPGQALPRPSSSVWMATCRTSCRIYGITHL